MKISTKLGFCIVFGAFLVLLPSVQASADTGRYFVKSTKGFWKNILGVRHEFDDGFSTDASDIQIGLAKIFGVELEPVRVLQILPDGTIPPSLSGEVITSTKTTPDPTLATTAPTLTPTPKPTLKTDAIKGKGSRFTRNTPSDQTPWGIETIYNNPAISSTSGGFGVSVAVLDTGVTTTHPDLARRIAQCKDFTGFKDPIVDGKCEDKNGHGTHVTGIVAADAGADGKGIYGVAPEASIFAYKVCGADGSCYADDIAAALRRAADEGANVVNMSFGSDKDDPLIHSAVDYAYSKGILLVAAAGNDGPFTDSIDYPAALAKVIAVSAINQSLAVTDWSSRGINSTTTPYIVDDHDIEFAAPGDHVESTWNNGGYVILSGTSMASPFVAGLAAKLWQSAALDPQGATRDLLHSLAPYPAEISDAYGFGLPQLK